MREWRQNGSHNQKERPYAGVRSVLDSELLTSTLPCCGHAGCPAVLWKPLTPLLLLSLLLPLPGILVKVSVWLAPSLHSGLLWQAVPHASSLPLTLSPGFSSQYLLIPGTLGCVYCVPVLMEHVSLQGLPWSLVSTIAVLLGIKLSGAWYMSSKYLLSEWALRGARSTIVLGAPGWLSLKSMQTLDLRVVSFSPMLGVKMMKNK